MDKAIEIVRRLLVSIIWLIAVGVFCMGVASFISPYSTADSTRVILTVLGTFVGAFALTKLVNWILLKD